MGMRADHATTEIKDMCWMEKRMTATGIMTAAVLRGLVQWNRAVMLEEE
jgi:hypothetical protein